MKLPEIQRGKVSIPTGNVGVAGAVNKARTIQEVSDTITKGLANIYEVNKDFETQRAKVNVQNDLAAFRTEIAGKEVYTAEEVRTLGLDEQVNVTEGEDIDGNPVDRTVIPAHEVVPLLTQQVLQRSIAGHSNTILDKRAQDNWQRDMGLYGQQQMEATMEAGKKAAIAWTLKERQVEMVKARRAGNYDGERELARVAYASNPALLAEHLALIDVAEEDDYYNRVVVDFTADAIDRKANELEQADLKDTAYDTNGRRIKVDWLRTQAENKRSDLATSDTKAMKAWQGAVYSSLANKIAAGDPVSWAQDFSPLLDHQYGKDVAFTNNLRSMYDNYIDSDGTSVHPKVSDPDVLQMLSELTDPELIETDVSLYSGSLTAGNYGTLVNRKNGAINADSTSTLVSSHASQLKAAVGDEDNPQIAAQADTLFRGLVEEEEKQLGRPLNTIELTRITDNILLSRIQGDVFDRPGSVGDTAADWYEDAHDVSAKLAQNYVDRIITLYGDDFTMTPQLLTFLLEKTPPERIATLERSPQLLQDNKDALIEKWGW